MTDITDKMRVAKALVWRQPSFGSDHPDKEGMPDPDYYYSDRYDIEKKKNGWLLRFNPGIKSFSTIDIAKAAAQADHETATRAAISPEFLVLFGAMVEALKPFADFASLRSFDLLADDAAITQGSRFAAKQLTAGELRKARAILALIPQEPKP